MELFDKGRSAIASKQLDIATANTLIEYGKWLMTSLRSQWAPPSKDLLATCPRMWQEELMLVAYRLSECFISNPRLMLTLGNQILSIILFASSQLKQLDVVRPLIEQMVQNLSSPNLLVHYFVTNSHATAVSVLLSAYESQLSESSIITACLFLAHYPGNESLITKHIEPLSEHFPVQVASLKAFLLIQTSNPQNKQQKLQEAQQILNDALKANPKDYRLLFNAAYVAALLRQKESSFKLVRASLESMPSEHRAIILLIRILRSNCQNDAVLSLASASRTVLDHWDKQIVTEAMFAAAENGDMPTMETHFQRLKKHWKDDMDALKSAVQLNLMLGKTQAASECLQFWAEFDKQSPDFFFYFSQLCISFKDYAEADRFLNFAIDLEPQKAEHYSSYSSLLLKSGQQLEAEKAARKAIRIDPSCFHGWLALSACVNGNQSHEALQKAIELRTSFIDLSGLSMILLPKDTHVVKASM